MSAYLFEQPCLVATSIRRRSRRMEMLPSDQEPVRRAANACRAAGVTVKQVTLSLPRPSPALPKPPAV